MLEHQILVEIFAMVSTRVQDAIDQQHILLRHDPYRVDSYRALYKLHFDSRQYDKAWCVASTLNFLRKAVAQYIPELIVIEALRDGTVRAINHEPHRTEVVAHESIRAAGAPFHHVVWDVHPGRVNESRFDVAGIV